MQKKLRILFFLVVLLFLVETILFAGGSRNNICETKDPIVMVHGIAVKDNNLLGMNYWWGIVDALEDRGAKIYVTDQHCYQSHEYRAEEIFKEFLYLRAIHGYKKFNIITHSQGALDSRYMISNCSTVLPKTDHYRPGEVIHGYEMVSSFTSISGVHRGTKMSDVGLKIVPKYLHPLITKAVDIVAKLFLYGEDNPDTLEAIKCLSNRFMTKIFNPNTPNMPGVYYQSWAGKIKSITPEMVLTPTWLITKALEGDNDGFVPVESAKWGNFRGVLSGALWCGGVSHWNEIGHAFGITPGFDAPDFYVDIVKELKDWGF